MKEVAVFEKVSYKQFKNDIMEYVTNRIDNCPIDAKDKAVAIEEMIEDLYNSIKLPKRATTGSAGYDFCLPLYDISIAPGETIKIPTGIKVQIMDGWVLKLYPRSGLGFKYRLQLDNTVGIIDSDYYNSDNEGHIFAKITNDTHSMKTVKLKNGDAFMQGLFCEYGITINDETDGVRNGGFGSTGV